MKIKKKISEFSTKTRKNSAQSSNDSVVNEIDNSITIFSPNEKNIVGNAKYFWDVLLGTCPNTQKYFNETDYNINKFISIGSQTDLSFYGKSDKSTETKIYKYDISTQTEMKTVILNIMKICNQNKSTQTDNNVTNLPMLIYNPIFTTIPIFNPNIRRY